MIDNNVMLTAFAVTSLLVSRRIAETHFPDSFDVDLVNEPLVRDNKVGKHQLAFIAHAFTLPRIKHEAPGELVPVGGSHVSRRMIVRYGASYDASKRLRSKQRCSVTRHIDDLRCTGPCRSLQRNFTRMVKHDACTCDGDILAQKGAVGAQLALFAQLPHDIDRRAMCARRSPVECSTPHRIRHRLPPFISGNCSP